MGEQNTQEKTGTVKDALNPQNDQPAASKGATETPAPTTFTRDQFEKEAEKRVAVALSKAGRDVKSLEAREAAVKAREDAANATQHEIDVLNIAKEHKIDPAALKEAAAELGLTAPEQIAALAKRLSGTAAGGEPFKPDSGRTVGGGPDTSKYSSEQFFEKGLEQLHKK
jgi:hypothetical protein